MGAVEKIADESICAKAAQIIAAAREAFLDQGYDAISMDEVARRASVAKQTVYSHFAGKEALFLAVVQREQQRMRIIFPDLASDRNRPIRVSLFTIGQRYLENMFNPEIRCVFRLAVAEANRFPTLGRSIREAGPKQIVLDLAGFLGSAASNGSLHIDDPAIAAGHFLALVRGELHLHCLLDPDFKPSPEQITRQLDGALDCFLGRYGAGAPQRSLPQPKKTGAYHTAL